MSEGNNPRSDYLETGEAIAPSSSTESILPSNEESARRNTPSLKRTRNYFFLKAGECSEAPSRHREMAPVVERSRVTIQ